MSPRIPVQSMALYEETGRRIRDLRRAKSISQERLAVAVGLSRTSITNIERGRQKVLLHTLSEIAVVLDVAIHDLIPAGSSMKSKLEAQLPSDASPKFRRFLSDIVEKRGTTS